MKSSLKDTIEKEYNETPAAPNLAVAAAQPENAVVTDKFFSNEQMEGEYDQSDFVIPSLNLTQSVGPLSEHFTPGQVVYNREEVVCEGWTEANRHQHVPLEFTVIRTKKFFLEKLAYGGEVMPRRFDTQDEALAAGLLPPGKKVQGMGNFGPVLSCQVLVKGVKGKHDGWPLEFGGTPYAMARYSLSSTGYYAAAKLIITSSEYGLRAGLHTGFWHLAPRREKVGANMVWVPRIKLAGRHTPEFIAWIDTLR